MNIVRRALPKDHSPCNSQTRSLTGYTMIPARTAAEKRQRMQQRFSKLFSECLDHIERRGGFGRRVIARFVKTCPRRAEHASWPRQVLALLPLLQLRSSTADERCFQRQLPGKYVDRHSQTDRGFSTRTVGPNVRTRETTAFFWASFLLEHRGPRAPRSKSHGFHAPPLVFRSWSLTWRHRLLTVVRNLGLRSNEVTPHCLSVAL
jgi:hypothetical protein